jgi:hypothetical protein
MQVPSATVMAQAAKIAVEQDRPIYLDYYNDSLEKKCCIGVQDQTKFLVKSDTEYTSPIVSILRIKEEKVFCYKSDAKLLAINKEKDIQFTWSGPNGYTSALQNPVINNIAANAGGIYTVTVSLSGCSSSATTTVVVNVTPALPTVAPVAYCQNTTATPLTASATSGNTLRWFTIASGGSPLAIAPTPSTASTGTTQYYVSQITASGCESGRATLTVTVSSTPIITNVIANNTLTCGGNEGSLVITGLSAGVTYTVKYTRGGSANTVSKTADGSGIITVGGLNLGAYSNIFVHHHINI